MGKRTLGQVRSDVIAGTAGARPKAASAAPIKTAAKTKTEGARVNIEELESLVNELLENQPREGRIESFMKKAGLSYSADPIEQISTILQALEGCGPARRAGGKNA